MERIKNRLSNLINNKIMEAKYSSMQIHKHINLFLELEDQLILIFPPLPDRIEMGLCRLVLKETTNSKTNLKIAETIWEELLIKFLLLKIRIPQETKIKCFGNKKMEILTVVQQLIIQDSQTTETSSKLDTYKTGE